MFDLLIQLPLHVAFAAALGFLTPMTPDGRVGWIDRVLALVALGAGAHYVVHHGRLATRMAMVDDPPLLDLVAGGVLALLLLEASRRHIGAALVILALGFVAYAFAGPLLPGFLSHGGVSVTSWVSSRISLSPSPGPHAGAPGRWR